MVSILELFPLLPMAFGLVMPADYSRNLNLTTIMRILRGFKLVTRVLLAATLLTTSTFWILAQDNGDPFTDLPLVNPTNVPPYATYWFLSTFDTNRYGFGPPLPWNPFSTNLDAPIYYW